MPTLFLSNIPYDCHDAELRQWIEMRGFQVRPVRLRVPVDFVHPHARGIILFGNGVEHQHARLDMGGGFDLLGYAL